MLLLDGCFLLELFLKYCFPSWTPNKDQLFTNRWIFNAVLGDVLLLENQIPFFVLETCSTSLLPHGHVKFTAVVISSNYSLVLINYLATATGTSVG